MKQPSRGVHMPTDGLTGWGEAARHVGEGFASVLTGTARVIQERAQVTAAGELADFSERLKSIEQETRDELASQDVQDWDYAWQTASAPKLAEAVNELSPTSRQAGQELAAAYNARAAVEARRDYELGKIDKARNQWRNQLENAVQAGDAQQAQEWLHAGQGIFVPESHVPAESQAIESQASLSRWKKNLQETPLRTLGDLSAAPEQDLPQQKTDAQHLAYARKLAGRTARQQVLSNLVSCMDSGISPEPEYMQMAVKAGVLSQEQADITLQGNTSALTLENRRDWIRRIDECPEEDEAAEALMLNIATSDMPASEKKSMLARIEQSRKLPLSERQNLSRNLWSMYHDGLFGCPSDAAAQRHFAALQQGCLSRLEKEGRQGVAQWLQKLRDDADHWVCFSPDNLA